MAPSIPTHLKVWGAARQLPLCPPINSLSHFPHPVPPTPPFRREASSDCRNVRSDVATRRRVTVNPRTGRSRAFRACTRVGDAQQKHPGRGQAASCPTRQRGPRRQADCGRCNILADLADESPRRSTLQRQAESWTMIGRRAAVAEVGEHRTSCTVGRCCGMRLGGHAL